MNPAGVPKFRQPSYKEKYIYIGYEQVFMELFSGVRCTYSL